MSHAHDTAPGGGPGAESKDHAGTRSGLIVAPVATQPPERFDVPEQLSRRRQAARRLPPLPGGTVDPLDPHRLPEPVTCSRGFACTAQPLEVLARAHHCPCVEAVAAVRALAAS